MSMSSSYIDSAAASSPPRIAEVAQCFRWLRMSSRPTPRRYALQVLLALDALHFVLKR
jgi:hypothetical protein